MGWKWETKHIPIAKPSGQYYSRLDQSGISRRVVGWDSGGDKFFELAPSFIGRDEFGNAVIDTSLRCQARPSYVRFYELHFRAESDGILEAGCAGQGKTFLYV